MWRSLRPFWGEEYTVHLPLDFHRLAFYVLDEDAVGSVCWGPRPLIGGAGTPQAPPVMSAPYSTVGAGDLDLALPLPLPTGMTTSSARSH